MRKFLYWIKHINILKSVYYSLRFKGKVIVGRADITIRQGGSIRFANKNSVLYLGVNYSYPTNSVLDIYNGTLLVEGSVSINRACKVRIYNGGILSIGNNSYINEGAKIYCSKKNTIGCNCAIAFDSLLMDTDTHDIFKENTVINTSAPICIGNDVWIGAKAIVLKGTLIESNTIVAANALAKGELKSHNIYGGVPVKKIQEFDSWKA